MKTKRLKLRGWVTDLLALFIFMILMLEMYLILY